MARKEEVWRGRKRKGRNRKEREGKRREKGMVTERRKKRK